MHTFCNVADVSYRLFDATLQALSSNKVKSSLASLLLLFSSLPVCHAASDVTLYIEAGTLSVNGAGGDVLDVWGFTDVSGSGPLIPGPVIESQEGDTFNVTIVNNHDRDHNFHIKGVSSNNTVIEAGKSHTYTISTPQAGVFFYRDTLANQVNREMGLYGALIVRSANGSQRAWSGGPGYDVERLWVVSDMDKSNWNDVAGSNNQVDTSKYKPNYFLMNGQGGFDGMHDPNSILAGQVGEMGLVRIVNAGQFDQSLHFHGNHFEVLSRDGIRLEQFEELDTINVKAGTTMMILYPFNQVGIFPMHVHTAQMETANGVYLNGTATLIVME